MRRVVVVVMACVLAFGVPAAARAGSGDPSCSPNESGLPVDPTGAACVFVDKATTGVDAQTQPVAVQDAWLTNALELQHRLGDQLTFDDAMWVGTHNSFNNAANTPPSLSNTDSNQHLSLVQQLDIGVRGIEIDVHWQPSVWAGGAYAPVVCHARPTSEFNAGCTDERLLADELAPVRDWSDAHRNDVILIYVEDALDQQDAFEAAAGTINDVLGARLFKPPSNSCTMLPLTMTRAQALAQQQPIIVMSGCGNGSENATNWRSTVFDDSLRAEEGNPEFDGYPSCSTTDGSITPATYTDHEHLVRFYEDSTFVSAAAAGGDPGHRMTVDEIGAMVRCGVNLFGLDQVDPNDPRLEAMVWSWAKGEDLTARDGACAVDGADGRFHAVACAGPRRHFACVTAQGEWFASSAIGRLSQGAQVCRRERSGATFAVPGSGAHAQLLRNAKSSSLVNEVWLAYSVVQGAWTALAG